MSERFDTIPSRTMNRDHSYAVPAKLADFKQEHFAPDVSVVFTNLKESFVEREKLPAAALKAALM